MLLRRREPRGGPPVKQNKGGRPPTGRPAGRKVTVYMQPATENLARSFGGGNLSGGVATAVKTCAAAAGKVISAEMYESQIAELRAICADHSSRLYEASTLVRHMRSCLDPKRTPGSLYGRADDFLKDEKQTINKGRK